MTSMTTKVTTPSPAAGLQGPLAAPWPAPAWSTEERLQRIRAMCQQINGYVEFMCQIGNLTGSSAEVKERAVAAFYERMVVVARQLGRIKEDLQLA
jgi:hypothetical protein